MSSFFNFDRSLPAPLDKIKSKKIPVSSKYGDGTYSTLTSTVVKAVMAYINCQTGTGLGAVGIIDHRTVAEYKSSADADAYHLAVYDSNKGSFLAATYDSATENTSQYTVHKTQKDGAVLAMAMMPLFLEDDEFKENYDAFMQCQSTGFPDITQATNYMAIMCDNAYRRTQDDTNPAHIKVVIEKSGNILPIRQAQLEAGTFTPKTVSIGEFTIMGHTGAAPVFTPTVVVEQEDFVGKYPLNPSRILSQTEIGLVPEIPSWHILTKEVIDICKHAQYSTGTANPMRNFLLRGPAGTGKTHDARAIAAGLGLPYVKFTCSADTDVFDFIGQVYPDFGTSTGDTSIDAELKMLEETGGITYENVKKLLDLPDADDMDFDPEGAYLRMTGVEKSDATAHNCMDIALSLVTDKVQRLTAAKYASSSDGPKYNYFETDFLMGLKNGYVIELQEPANITQPGVLTGLNDLLEQAGTILLPDKRRIKRHPDAVVVITTNISYEGCRPLNQSVLDRMNKIKDIAMPSPAIMCQRAMSVTGCDDDRLVSQMVQVVTDMADYCNKNGVVDGNVGMRSLIDWIISTECTGNAYESALDTIVSRATADEEEQATLITSYLEPYFSEQGILKK